MDSLNGDLILNIIICIDNNLPFYSGDLGYSYPSVFLQNTKYFWRFTVCPLFLSTTLTCQNGTIKAYLENPFLSVVLLSPAVDWQYSVPSFPPAAFSPSTTPWLPFCLTNQLESESHLQSSHMFDYMPLATPNNQMRINCWSVFLH